jgi:hypothetical protein
MGLHALLYRYPPFFTLQINEGLNKGKNKEIVNKEFRIDEQLEGKEQRPR